jgi:hypothetical protein
MSHFITCSYSGKILSLRHADGAVTVPAPAADGVLFGLIYGALVYFFMHLIVLPLSAVPPRSMPFIYKAFEFVEHWFCVGLPIALSVRQR